MIEILMKPGMSISGSNSNLFIKVKASLSDVGVAFFSPAQSQKTKSNRAARKN